MKTTLAAMLFLSTAACAVSPEIMARAESRRLAEFHLKRCLRDASWAMTFQVQCARASVEECRSRGLEASCAADGLATGGW